MTTEVLSSAVPPAPAPRTIECRVRQRHPCPLPTRCQPIADRAESDLAWWGRIRDISASGVSLVLYRRFEPGTSLFIELVRTAEGPTELLVARVVHATALAEEEWLLGCNFARELGAEELKGFLELAQPQEDHSLPHAPSVARLTAKVLQGGLGSRPRRRSGATMTIPDLLLQGTGVEGQDIQLHVQRLRLIGDWPVEEKSILRVRIAEKADNAEGIQLRVEDCSRLDNGRWRVTYSFVEEPSPEVLHFFGQREQCRKSPASVEAETVAATAASAARPLSP